MTSIAFGARVARHAILSLMGLAIPLVIALIAIPVTVRALGPARFGLLGLAWTVVEYGGFFDFGLGRATVRFVADALVRSPRDNIQIIPVAFATQVLTGLVAGFLVYLAAPYLAAAVFTIPATLQGEAAAMFVAVGANLAIVIAIGALRGALEGAQRFDLSTFVKIPTATAAIVIPAYGATHGWSLDVILWWVFAARFATLVTLVVLMPRAIDHFRWEPPREWRRLGALFRYSGWLTVSGFANPILINLDRLVLGSIAGVAAVGFYTGPYEGATRLLLVPVSIFAALFPVLTATESSGDRGRTVQVMESSLRQTTLLMAAPVLMLIAFAPEILGLWLGPPFVAEATTALRILAVGVLANSLGPVPMVFLYAVGRPDLPAKLHAAEVALHIPLTVLLVSRFGVTGAAAAWATRAVVDMAAMAAIAGRLGAWRFDRDKLRLWSATGGLIGALIVVLYLDSTAFAMVPSMGLAIAGVATLAFAAAGWRFALATGERSSLLALFRGPDRSEP